MNKTSVVMILTEFWSLLCGMFAQISDSIQNAHGILGMVHAIFEVFQPSNYQDMWNWLLVEVPVTDQLYIPKGFFVLAFLLLLDRMFTPTIRSMRRILLPIARANLQKLVARTRVFARDVKAGAELGVEETIRQAKLIPSKVKTSAITFATNTKNNFKAIVKGVVDFGKFCIVIAKGIYTFIKFLYRIVKVLCISIKTGMGGFKDHYAYEQRQAQMRKAYKTQRAEEKARNAFAKRYGYLPSANAKLDKRGNIIG